MDVASVDDSESSQNPGCVKLSVVGAHVEAQAESTKHKHKHRHKSGVQAETSISSAHSAM